MDEFSLNISIPTDDEGYVLLRCPKCGEFFKLRPEDIESENVKDIYCPLCGLTSDSFLTDDVIEAARIQALNKVMGILHKEMVKLEKKTKNSIIQFKAGKYQEEEEIPINSSIDAMEIYDFDCCNKSAKIRYLTYYSGCYCPFCGGKVDGDN